MQMNPEQREMFIAWAEKEFGVAVRTMLDTNATVHAFDCDGITAEVKEPWSFVILVMPRKAADTIMNKLEATA